MESRLLESWVCKRRRQRLDQRSSRRCDRGQIGGLHGLNGLCQRSAAKAQSMAQGEARNDNRPNHSSTQHA
ncbi:hypothetical protein BN1012_Phect822 [Candidatus Phaeomarinobacter ectocarpi]|uniref:Uncharacterized protein n=1 Tax=Candidatus Phaeomarinibacter ectocarpi TaxID=1458461 RepID=X5MM85_9HYPH|nr:hypothetical protein BN1012_Phect822 [Candidatus Phaeomarinobacter ectocarpi]